MTTPSLPLLLSKSLPGWLEAAQAPGAAVALLERGKEPAFLCAGVASRAAPAPIHPLTVFEAASLGKPIFAALALELAAGGLFDLDAPLSDLLPDPWVPGDDRLPLVTARRVLSHSTGFPNWFWDGAPRFDFTPGERFGYSGVGYQYLQKVVERLAGRSLDDLASERIFTPLGMARSRYTWPQELAQETAYGHPPEGEPLKKWEPTPSAGASLHSTLADYARFLQAMLDGSLPAAAQMLQPHTPIHPSLAWGLGWGLLSAPAGPVFWQWGDSTGYKHMAAGSMEEGRAVLVFTNGEHGWMVWKEILHATLDPGDEIWKFLDQLY